MACAAANLDIDLEAFLDHLAGRWVLPGDGVFGHSRVVYLIDHAEPMAKTCSVRQRILEITVASLEVGNVTVSARCTSSACRSSRRAPRRLGDDGGVDQADHARAVRVQASLGSSLSCGCAEQAPRSTLIGRSAAGVAAPVGARMAWPPPRRRPERRSEGRALATVREGFATPPPAPAAWRWDIAASPRPERLGRGLPARQRLKVDTQSVRRTAAQLVAAALLGGSYPRQGGRSEGRRSRIPRDTVPAAFT